MCTFDASFEQKHIRFIYLAMRNAHGHWASYPNPYPYVFLCRLIAFPFASYVILADSSLNHVSLLSNKPYSKGEMELVAIKLLLQRDNEKRPISREEIAYKVD